MRPVMLSVAVLLIGLAPFIALILARWQTMTAWAASVVAYRLQPPASLSVDNVAAWLANIQALTHPRRLAVVPLSPSCLEVVSTTDGIAFYVLVPRDAASKLLSGIRATLPGCRLSEAAGYLNHRPGWQLAAELIMTNLDRPLGIERAEHTAAALLTSLQPLVGDATEVRLQYILTSAGTARPVPTPGGRNQASAAWWENTPPPDAEAVQAARVKRRDPLLRAVVRVGVAAQNQAQARALFGRVWNNYHMLNNVGVRLRKRWLPSWLVARRLVARRYPVTAWPLLISSREGAGLLSLPVSGTPLPGVSLAVARQLPPPQHMVSHDYVLGTSNYPGLTDRAIALKVDDRLRHQFILGPTGSGKSWLLANLILKDIAAGRGVIVLDPKGDLVTDVLGRIEDTNAERVVVLDAAQRDYPIGLNVLGNSHDEAARERTVDDVLHVFRSIWAEFWGPRSDALCRAALTTLVASRGVDGAQLTLCELVPLLTEPGFRRSIVSQPGLADTLRAYWQRYERMSDGERQQVIAPLVNKVEAFTSRTPIRLMLGQSRGFDLRDIFTHRKAVLVSLAKGTLGEETARLLGCLLVSLLWQATLSRASIPAEQRHPCFAYIDEASDVMRLPIPLADMAAQARGLGLGLVVATQILAQVPDSFKAAFLGTIRTQAVFAVERDDAKLLEPRFAPLTADDLQGLGRFEVALRPCLDGITRTPLTLTTLPLPEAGHDGQELVSLSQQRYGQSRAEVEAALRARIAVTPLSSSVGRRVLGDRS